jgi:glycosyltransferase involved in cell wall biosynthesis
MGKRMSKPDLSVIIPSRNELFLSRTVDDILKNMRGNTEIIAGLDGAWADPPLKDHPKVHIIHHSKSIGQRAITNECAKLSRAKYLMKCDAHCSFDEGFDVKMMQEMKDDWTMVPLMKNFHVFDWICKKCGDRRYQSPTPTSCPKCDNTTDFERDIVWFAKNNPQSTTYCFDSEPHFQYFREFKKRPEGQGDITETMSLQGSCFMVTRDKYFELNLSDETFGSWGSQGIEVAVKTWLSGGRVVCNQKTWYGHMFRTQGGDFGFPYDISGRQVSRAKKYARDLFFNNKWPKQVHPLSWLIDKFWPVPGWSDDARMAVKEQGKGFIGMEGRFASGDIEGGVQSSSKGLPDPSHKSTGGLTKGLCFYTDNRVAPGILNAVRARLEASLNGYRLVTVSLKPLDFGENIVLNLRRGYLAMAKQQLAGLERLDTDIAFMVEHDILYPPCHFDFTPPRKDVFYYNLNWWKCRSSDGQALHFKAKQVSGLCAYRDILVDYYRKRVAMMESGEIGGRRHFEPGGRHQYREEGYNKLTAHGFDTWFSEIPYVDIRHETCVTRNIFDPSGYRGQVVDWTLQDFVPGWGVSKDRFTEFLREATDAV